MDSSVSGPCSVKVLAASGELLKMLFYEVALKSAAFGPLSSEPCQIPRALSHASLKRLARAGFHRYQGIPTLGFVNESVFGEQTTP